MKSTPANSGATLEAVTDGLLSDQAIAALATLLITVSESSSKEER